MALILSSGSNGDITATSPIQVTSSSYNVTNGKYYLFQIDTSTAPSLSGCETLTTIRTGIIGSGGSRRVYAILAKATSNSIGGLTANETFVSELTVD